MKVEVSNAIRVDERIYEFWLEFINPFYRLTNREIELGGCMLRYFMKFLEKTDDEKIANQLLFSTRTRNAIREELGLNKNYFDVLLNKLRVHNFIATDKETGVTVINKRVIPKITKKDKNISLLIYFDLNGQKKNTAN